MGAVVNNAGILHRAGGWTPETIGSHAIPALRASFHSMERTQDVFSWDPL